MATGQVLMDSSGRPLRDGDGKVKLWAPAPVDLWHDAKVDSANPDTNYGWTSGCGTTAGLPGSRTIYGLIKGPMNGAGTLWIYANHEYPDGGPAAVKAIDIWEIIEDWDEIFVTWNNSPALGDQLIALQENDVAPCWDSYVLPHSTYGYLLALQTETFESRGRQWLSHLWPTDPSQKPYWVAD